MKFILFLLLALIPFSAEAQTLSTYRVRAPEPAILQSLARLFDIESRTGDVYEVIVPSEQANLLLMIEPAAQLIHLDNSKAIREQLQSFQFFTERGYHNLAEVQQWMRDLESKFPQKVRIVQYGTSQQQRPLLALQITKDVNAAEGASLMITAATHGDELITVEVVMNLVDKMLNNYGKNPRFTQMINNNNIYFIPVVNPDGYARQDRYDNGRDPNRSYPFPNKPSNTPTKSIAAIMEFFAAKNIVGSIDFHAYGEMIMYPWAYTHDSVEAPFAQHFNNLTKNMADSNRYVYGPISDVIYVAPGSSADYYFWQKKSLSLGIEIGNQKVPNPIEFPEYFESQEESTWRFIESFAGRN